MIEITETAKEKIKEVLSTEKSDSKLRMFVQGGGCSGFSYGFSFDEEKNEDDFEVTFDEITVLIDSMSAQYVSGATIDFKDDLQGARFSINNPNAQTTCGCGSSFSPY